jgi:hypothetical protein
VGDSDVVSAGAHGKDLVVRIGLDVAHQTRITRAGQCQPPDAVMLFG